MYELRLARTARKELDALPDAVLNRVARQLDALAMEPRPRGCKKLRGAGDLWSRLAREVGVFAKAS